MRMGNLIVGMTSAVLPLSASAQPAADPYDLATGNGLLAACTADDQRERERCAAFLEGYVSGANASSYEIGRKAAVEGGKLRPFCVPQGVTVGQAKDVVVKGLSDAPQARHLPSQVLVMLLMQKAFRC